jgi:anaerobic selenocysteine-containing dehydrogenase/Fe-S-cluster-containing dehydrogenase component
MAHDLTHRIDRRVALKLIAGGVAGGVAAGCSPRHAPDKLVPYMSAPESIVPGKSVHYRTVCRECPASCGVTARTREGRVIKVEGNPDDPIGRGALCARGQATLQALYATDRFRGPMKRDPSGRLVPASWEAATEAFADALRRAKAKDVRSIRLLSRPEPGSAGALQRAFMKALGAASEQRIVVDPFDPAPVRQASSLLFRRPELPVYDLGKAKTIVCFGADFVETWVSPVQYARSLSSGRGKVGVDRTRFLWIGPRLSVTGASADEWISIRPGGELWLALGVLRWLVDPDNAVEGLAPEARRIFGMVRWLDLEVAERESGVGQTRIVGIAAELAKRRPSALLGPGIANATGEATALAATLHLINWLLGNVGHTVLFGLDPLEDPPSPPSSLQALFGDMNEGRVGVLLVQHADPLGALPAALGAAEALARVPFIVSFSDLPDPTTEKAHLVLPDHHFLESYGDVTPRRGMIALLNAAMTPLAQTRSASQVLLDVARTLPQKPQELSQEDFYEYARARGEKVLAELGATEDTAYRAAQERGGCWVERPPSEVTLAFGELAQLLRRPPSVESPSEALELVVFPTALRQDAHSSRLPWLCEVPDVLTTISWSGWAELSPATAARFGIATGDAIALTTPHGRAELPAFVSPGVRDGVVAVPMGGAEPLALLAASFDPRSGALAWLGTRAVLQPLGRSMRLAIGRGAIDQQGRHVARTVSSESPSLPRPEAPSTLYPPPEFPTHRWAMTVDMDRCTGCQACVVACYAENNIPVVGPKLLADDQKGMAWLRVERYFAGEPGSLHADFLLMLCQQCGNAPCESVCPVNATYHTSEGLNAQVYNRCVGTRYCSNNCPYQVRAFNWKEGEFPFPLDMQLNPDVTVRSKGVMEKCTFCVQRIRTAELSAKTEGRHLSDHEIVPACAQTCPAQAITFGDAADPSSQVAKLQQDGRGYHVLGELNTLPAITYLARVRQDEP